MTKLAEPPTLRFEPWDIESEWLRDHGGQLERCVAGEHEECPGTLEAGATRILRCSCGCHMEPWPFPCAENPEGGR